MENKLGSEPAFPQGSDSPNSIAMGMTIRQYLAAKAMQALIVSWTAEHAQRCAEDAWKVADAMLQSESQEVNPHAK